MFKRKIKKVVDKTQKKWYNKSIVRQIKIYRSVEIMRKQAEMNATRENFIEGIENTFALEGATLVGRAVEGLVFETKHGYTVVKTIVKKAGFDAEDAIAEYTEKIAAAEVREQAKKDKAAKRAVKKE